VTCVLSHVLPWQRANHPVRWRDCKVRGDPLPRDQRDRRPMQRRTPEEEPLPVCSVHEGSQHSAQGRLAEGVCVIGSTHADFLRLLTGVVHGEWSGVEWSGVEWRERECVCGVWYVVCGVEWCGDSPCVSFGMCLTRHPPNLDLPYLWCLVSRVSTIYPRVDSLSNEGRSTSESGIRR
jgi:hypothetical protein